MPSPTYTLISETVLGSAQASVTFSSIPGTYKDLVLEFVPSFSTSDYSRFRVNSDTGNNYSSTIVYGTGSAAASYRETNGNTGLLGYNNYGVGFNTSVFVQFMSYANTNVNKSMMSRVSASAGDVIAGATLWRNTAAITSIELRSNSQNYASGSTFRLWGVLG